ELLAIKLALEEWRLWLEGSNHPFTIITDHKNLQYLREARHLNPRQARWALFFTRFNFKITYRPGSKNISADALSQQFSSYHPAEPEPIIPSNLIINPILWEQDDTIRQATLQEPTPLECPEGKIFLISVWALDIQVANGPSCSFKPDTGGPVCAVIPSGTSRAALSMLCLPLPVNFPQENWYHYPFHRGPGPILDNTCILVMVDRFSKMCKFFPLKGLPTALKTAEHLFQQVFRHFGFPEEIVSDRGPQFISHLLGVSVNLSSGYHPQTNGQTERKIQELGRYLWAYCCKDQHSWSSAYSVTSLCFSPGRRNLPMFQLERVWDSAHHHPQRAVRQHKSFADVRRRPAPAYQPGDQVWLSICDLRLRQPCRKLSPSYIGPFKILRRINDVTFQLQLPPRYRIHPTFHVSLLKPFYPSATETPGAEAEPPPPSEVLDQPSIYTVHEILDLRRRGGHLEYLVDWEGYGPEKQSWVPRDDILNPDRPAPRGCGHPRRHVRASGATPGGG
ncbi:hypothetical protein M9458_033277, partial [Cirrhinus mrigala]